MHRRGAFLALAAIVVGSLGAGSARADGTERLGVSEHQLLIGGGVVSEGVGLAGRTSDPAQPPRSGTITIGGIPGGASVAQALFYWAVLGDPDPNATLNGQDVSGTPIGSSVDTWSCGLSQARNYVYRADVTSIVGGNGTYAVAGVGDVANTDAQGASLVVLYEDDSQATVTEVSIADGAITGGNLGDGPPNQYGQPTGGNELISSTLDGLSVPAAPLGARLHVGFGDGAGVFDPNSPAAGPLRFQGVTLAPPGFLASTDGPLWDDQTFDLAPGTVPAGTTAVTADVNSGYDCILWAFTVLEMKLPDRFPPSVRGVTDRAPNAAGWFDAPVMIHWTAKDPSGATQPADTNAATEGKDVVYTSEPSCDGGGNCASGALALSLDLTPPETQVRPGGFLFFDQPPVDTGVHLFDQWVSGTLTDALSGVEGVRIVAENVATGVTTEVHPNNFWCNPDRTSCDFDAQIPSDPGVYRVHVSAIDVAGNADATPAELTMILPPDPFGGECPLGPLCD